MNFRQRNTWDYRFLNNVDETKVICDMDSSANNVRSVPTMLFKPLNYVFLSDDATVVKKSASTPLIMWGIRSLSSFSNPHYRPYLAIS